MENQNCAVIYANVDVTKILLFRFLLILFLRSRVIILQAAPHLLKTKSGHQLIFPWPAIMAWGAR